MYTYIYSLKNEIITYAKMFCVHLENGRRILFPKIRDNV